MKNFTIKDQSLSQVVDWFSIMIYPALVLVLVVYSIL